MTGGGDGALASFTVFGSRTLLVKSEGRGCISLPQKPGSFYVGNLCALEHNVEPCAESAGCYGEGPPSKQVQIAVMLRPKEVWNGPFQTLVGSKEVWNGPLYILLGPKEVWNGPFQTLLGPKEVWNGPFQTRYTLCCGPKKFGTGRYTLCCGPKKFGTGRSKHCCCLLV